MDTSPRYLHTSSWEKQVFVVILEVEELKGLLASLPVSAFTLSSVWLVKEEERSISRSSTYLPIDSQVYGYYREEDRVVMARRSRRCAFIICFLRYNVQLNVKFRKFYKLMFSKSKLLQIQVCKGKIYIFYIGLKKKDLFGVVFRNRRSIRDKKTMQQF